MSSPAKAAKSAMSRISRIFNRPFRGADEYSPQHDLADSDPDQEWDGPLRPEDNILRRCDSRMIAMASHELRRAFPDKDINPRLVFDNPSISSLSSAIEGLPSRAGGAAGAAAAASSAADAEAPEAAAAPGCQPFTQFMGGPQGSAADEVALAEKAFFDRIRASRRGGVYGAGGSDRHFFRLTDGMEAILLPAAVCRIGNDGEAAEDCDCEGPSHDVELSSFLMDVEPVSIGAYVRFLNMATPAPTPEMLLDWCLLEDGDERSCHVPVIRTEDGTWKGQLGIPLSWPMILVSWYGANAYSLWAHGRDYRSYRSAAWSFLPSEAQWEYAARGAARATYPWGSAPARPGLLNVCWNLDAYDGVSHVGMPLKDLPLECVNVELGVSPFGLRGMAGNVWQWCRDTYDEDFYVLEAASRPDACNTEAGPMKSERGGSWVGPASLARSAHRRGRAPEAKGRCLGFRCCAPIAVLDEESTAPSTGAGSEHAPP